MRHIQQHESDEHWDGVETIHVGFGVWDGAIEAAGVFDEAEDDADLDENEGLVVFVGWGKGGEGEEGTYSDEEDDGVHGV